MRIYLTSSWANKARMPWLQGWLQKQGHKVVSTWHDRHYPADVPNDWWAAVDLAEIDSADALVMFTLGVDADCLGAMDFEAGYALAQAKRLYWIGESARNVFMSRYAEPWPAQPPRGKLHSC